MTKLFGGYGTGVDPELDLLTYEWLQVLPGSAGLKPDRVSVARAMRALG